MAESCIRDSDHPLLTLGDTSLKPDVALEPAMWMGQRGATWGALKVVRLLQETQRVQGQCTVPGQT